MANEKIGANLMMCIPPDHMRNDLPTLVSPADVTHCAYVYGGDKGPVMPNVYVGVTDDMGNTVMLPCFDVQYVDSKVVVMAHRTGRPVA